VPEGSKCFTVAGKLALQEIADAKRATQRIYAEPYNESLYMSLIPGIVFRQAGGACN
jgi:hypothetical protein